MINVVNKRRADVWPKPPGDAFVANGDIGSPHKAREVLAATGADAVMIGRAAQGRPWIFREIAHFLATGETLPPPAVSVWL